MENNRKTVRKRSARLVAALLTAVMVFTVALSGTALAAGGEASGSTKTLADILTAGCKVKVLPVDTNSELYADLMTVDIVADLYLVGTAVKDSGMDSYSFSFDLDNDGTVDSPFAGIVTGGGEMDYDYLSGKTAADWEALAQTIADIALDEKNPVAVTASVKADGKTQSAALTAGLYLIVPHGSELTALADYVETVTDENNQEVIYSIAKSSKGGFRFAPQLVTLPTKEPDANGVISSANSSPWIDEVTVVCKPTPYVLDGYLVIEKTLANYVGIEAETSDVNNDVAFFTYNITWTVGTGEKAKNYAATESISFGAGTNSTSATDSVLLAQHFPIGTEVTITENYDGSRYKPTSATEVKVTIPEPDKVPEGKNEISAEVEGETVCAGLASFSNTHDGSFNGGGGISNTFEYTENDGWKWVAVPASKTTK